MTSTYQLCKNTEFTQNSDQVLDIMKSSGIGSILQSSYSNIHQVMQKNPVGCMKMLIATGCVSGGVADAKFKIYMNERFANGVDAWTQYLEKIKLFLKKINDNEDLNYVRDSLARRIHSHWYKQAPQWASIGSYGSTFTMTIDDKGKVSSDVFTFLYSVEGEIYMQDYRKSSDVFEAHIWSEDDRPIKMKCIKLNKKKLNDLNSQKLQSLMKAAEHSEKEQMKSLTLQFEKMFG